MDHFTISVSVKTRAHKTCVEEIDEINFKVSVKERPVDGQANEAVIEALADYFKIPKSQLKIKKGGTGRKKIIEVG